MTLADQDCAERLRERVLAAAASGTPVNIVGGGSKAFYGRPAQGDALETSGHAGILYYEPTELVLTARCGTRLDDIEAMLAAHGQMLAFEPPHFGGGATLGGVVACGLAGPRRPFAGSVRDAVLGVKLLNGRGEILKFGGQVMKNVAGFDVSRLMAGALGTLGLLLEVSVRVHPRPGAELTLRYSLDGPPALTRMHSLARRSGLLSAACHEGDCLSARLSGSEAALRAAEKQLGGERLASAEADRFWADLREQRLAFFRDDRPLWRLSLPCAASVPPLTETLMIDWGGALRWLKTDAPPDVLFSAASRLGGHACRFRAPDGGLFQPLTPGVRDLHKKLKAAFDPGGIFNPGRLYPDW